MAKKTEAQTSTSLALKEGSVVMIALSNLTPGKNYSRLFKPTEEEWKNIANQLRGPIKAGTVDAIHVSTPTDKGKYTVLAGFQRWQVAKEMEAESIPCLLTGLEPDSTEAVLDNFSENIHRQDLSFVERATAMQKYAELKGIDNWTNSKEIARFFRVEVPTLRLSKLIVEKCSKAVLERVHRDEMDLDAARILANFPEDVQEKLTEKATEVQKEEQKKMTNAKNKVTEATTKEGKKAARKEVEEAPKRVAKKVNANTLAKAADKADVSEDTKAKVKKAASPAKKTSDSKLAAAQETQATLDMTYEWADGLAKSKNPFVAALSGILTKLIDKKLTPKAATKELEVMLAQEDVEAAA